ncbi:unnamed protein product [Prunus armeniaca]|uniref:Uncharacterized protein n=1 Tax=Prunus armeniaca TaxID=36596 RepID=A0A6J5U6R6_PRUAR|nr:unnamed protein product [Prunus armeniaca]
MPPFPLQICPVFSIFNRDFLFANADDDDCSRARGATALSSSLRSPLKKLFFEKQDTSTLRTSFYNLGGGLRFWSMRSTSFCLIINTLHSNKEIFLCELSDVDGTSVAHPVSQTKLYNE